MCLYFSFSRFAISFIYKAMKFYKRTDMWEINRLPVSKHIEFITNLNSVNLEYKIIKSIRKLKFHK